MDEEARPGGRRTPGRARARCGGRARTRRAYGRRRIGHEAGRTCPAGAAPRGRHPRTGRSTPEPEVAVHRARHPTGGARAQGFEPKPRRPRAPRPAYAPPHEGRGRGREWAGRPADHARSRGEGAQIVILTRGAASVGRVVAWDSRTVSTWASEIDGADVVINLAGRTVNCRYTEENLRQMRDSRVLSTRAIEAIAAARTPPRRLAPDEHGHDLRPLSTPPTTRPPASSEETSPRCPRTGGYRGRVKIAREWEAARSPRPAQRPGRAGSRALGHGDEPRSEGGIFDEMLGLVRRGWGGRAGGGAPVRVVDPRARLRSRDRSMLIAREDIEGPVNLARRPSPSLTPQLDESDARRVGHRALGLPATAWMLGGRRLVIHGARTPSCC